MDARKMEIVAILILAFVAVPTFAADHVVGGSSQWGTGVDYVSWASGQTFNVGDTLTFQYISALHTVDTLSSKSDFENCNTGKAVSSDSGGSTTITLSKAGTTYYACGTAGHCSQGMKLAVTTVAASDSKPGATPPSSGGSSPTTPSTTPTTPTTTGTSSTTAAAGAGAVGKALLGGALAATGLALLG